MNISRYEALAPQNKDNLKASHHRTLKLNRLRAFGGRVVQWLQPLEASATTLATNANSDCQKLTQKETAAARDKL